MDRSVRWGVIGSGGIASRRTIPEGIAAASNAVLAAVHDIDVAANAAVAVRFGARPHGTIEDLLSDDLDSVYIATPAFLHREQILACARAGRHVLCEKPLGRTVREAEEVVEACRRSRVLLGVGFMMRFHAQHRAALDLVRGGRLGKLVFARAQLSCWYPPMPGAWRQIPERGGGGSLVDMGGHCIDLLEMLFGRARQVSCVVRSTVHPYAPEDSAVALLLFENGALGTVDTFFCIPDEGSRNALELYGSDGSILASGTIGQESRGIMRAFFRPGGRGYDPAQARDATEGLEIAPVPMNTYRAEIEDFSAAILDGREPAVGGDLGLRSQRVLEACYESARTGRAVELTS